MRRLKNFPLTLEAHIGHLPKGKPIEVWFQDGEKRPWPQWGRESAWNRLGQKNGRTRIRAKWGTRPPLPADQRYANYANAYLFGAICPKRGVGAAPMLPRANTPAMQMHFDEISRSVA